MQTYIFIVRHDKRMALIQMKDTDEALQCLTVSCIFLSYLLFKLTYAFGSIRVILC